MVESLKVKRVKEKVQGMIQNLSKKKKSKSMHYLGENEDKNILNMR